MTPYVFIERSRLGKSFYELRGDHLTISGTRWFEPYKMEVELSSASPDTERLSRRFYRPIIVLLSIGTVLAGITAALLLQTYVPDGAAHYFVHEAGVAAAAFIGAGLTWIPRIKVVRFRDSNGSVLFDVVKERRQAEDFEKFIEYLQETIVQSKSTASPIRH